VLFSSLKMEKEEEEEERKSKRNGWNDFQLAPQLKI
jgi:hypothetical protein